MLVLYLENAFSLCHVNNSSELMGSMVCLSRILCVQNSQIIYGLYYFCNCYGIEACLSLGLTVF